MVTNIPNTIAVNFVTLNLWFSEPSNKIIVEIWRKTPIINAEISEWYVVKKSIFSATKTPKGLINPKITKKLTTVVLENFECNKKVDSTMAIGILWTTIAHKRFASSLWIGMPSENAWIHKLINNRKGNLVSFEWIWIWPCSAPLEKDSKIDWTKIPTKIKIPILVVLVDSSYTSGNKCNMVTDSKYAPLNDSNSLVILLDGLKSSTVNAPIKTDSIRNK